MKARLTPEELARAHDGMCGVSIGDGECSCLVHWIEGLQKDLDAKELQKGVADEMLSQAMEILTKIVDSEEYPIGLRCDSQELLRRWQRGEHLQQTDKPIRLSDDGRPLDQCGQVKCETPGCNVWHNPEWSDGTPRYGCSGEGSTHEEENRKKKRIVRRLKCSVCGEEKDTILPIGKDNAHCCRDCYVSMKTKERK